MTAIMLQAPYNQNIWKLKMFKDYEIEHNHM